MTRVLLAPDKFKGTLTAARSRVTSRPACGRSCPTSRSSSCPSPTVATAPSPPPRRPGSPGCRVTATGPTGMPCASACGRRGTEAVVELAEVSGLAQLPGGRLQPLDGHQPRHRRADRRRPRRGCPTHRRRDRRQRLHRRRRRAAPGARAPRSRPQTGSEVGPGGAALRDGAPARPQRACTPAWPAPSSSSPATSTTRSPGARGAAAVYGPQKGAGPERRRAAGRRADPLGRPRGRAPPAQTCATTRAPEPPAGSASALIAVLGATTRPGAELVFELTGLPTPSPAPTSSSPARARSTPRPCTARPRPPWPRWPATRACRAVAVAGQVHAHAGRAGARPGSTRHTRSSTRRRPGRRRWTHPVRSWSGSVRASRASTSEVRR